MVKDHGIGIEADKLDYIFNRFYRADESRAQNNNNFGLGLAIAKRICSYYDYAITVESTVSYTHLMLNAIEVDEVNLMGYTTWRCIGIISESIRNE